MNKSCIYVVHPTAYHLCVKYPAALKSIPSVSQNQGRQSHRPFKMRVVHSPRSGFCKLLALIKELLPLLSHLIRFNPLPPQVEDSICFRRPISGCHREKGNSSSGLCSEVVNERVRTEWVLFVGRGGEGGVAIVSIIWRIRWNKGS